MISHPIKKPCLGKTPFRTIRLMEGGSTDSSNWIWSGDTLMDLDRSQALKITSKTIGRADYLFIEAGGFSPKNPAGWKCPLMVMQRK